MNWRLLLSAALAIGSTFCKAQERTAPVNHNPFLSKDRSAIAMKTSAQVLPFFEDFTNYGPFPDPAKWADKSVYINNTMCFQPVSFGVATFDALNAAGGPYDSSVNTALVYADSLTSLSFDLNVYTPADSIYLSFFYQPQGNGFAPESQDSLMLYLKGSAGTWTKVWSAEGTTLLPFKQVMVPIADTGYFHSAFQFRFVNKASININDDVWNLDYIRLDANRNIHDTAVNDVAAATEPSFLLGDYTALPYRQFTSNMSAELAAQHFFYLRNNYSVVRPVTYGYTAREALTNTPLFSGGQGTAVIPAQTEQQFQFPIYPISFSAPPYSKVVFENKYYAAPQGGGDPVQNDTIIKEQVFDNYLSYDDGTAEKSYFLNEFATLPAKTAIEFHLNQPDTLRGVAIYFGRTVPLATSKFFAVDVYDDIAVNGGVDSLIYEQDLLFPQYVDTINHFWVYRFDFPVAMKAGTFYLGTLQPAASGSDSIYFGLDVNRIGGNHLYFDVSGFWEPSLVSGALMVRPILGQPIIGTDIKSPAGKKEPEWTLFPNPATDAFTLRLKDNLPFSFELMDMQGRILLRNKAFQTANVDISRFSPGIYFVRIFANGHAGMPKKIIKQ